MMKSKSELLKEIQSVTFAMYDLLLYLDTHSCDKKAFKMFKELGEKRTALMNEYVKNYGSLSQFDSAKLDEFDWLNGPWPWERAHDSKNDQSCQNNC